ncbi:MAG: glutamine-hydrolyzing GMP synthase [Spirochaetia bacterium]|nr:glutamine-hydrolyzing GMP synthase [Spirochaetia bacterium]
MTSKIGVIDFGGQYAHLIASRIRRLGALAEIADPETLTPAEARKLYAGLILSGGPSSVYEAEAPASDPGLFAAGIPVLGICYGHQLMMHQLGGEVKSANTREFGPAVLHVEKAAGILTGETGKRASVWMSHGDEVVRLPEGFESIGKTDDCRFAAVLNSERRLYGIQFHPEVTHTERGDAYLQNFIKICNLENTYRLEDFLSQARIRLKEEIGDRSVFFLLSGGVDSTVAFTMLTDILPPDRLYGLFIDTGFMRKDEGLAVERALQSHKIRLNVEDASPIFHERLRGVVDPEKKRKIIGDLFIEVQASRVIKLNLDPDKWILGQGTIYPDTIESGGTKKSHLIKTHHNRVPAIQKMIDEGKVIEPIKDLYKDEVRQVGTLLGLPDELVFRHPFPGPGLAIRCLCSDILESTGTISSPDAFNMILNKHGVTGEIFPLRSVGVQGDQRTYAHPIAIYSEKNGSGVSRETLLEIARALPNLNRTVNRVLFLVAGKRPTLLRKSSLTLDRVNRLREADHIVSSFLFEKQIYDVIWQFPVVLVPLSTREDDGDALILRPVVSADAMTVSPYPMTDGHLNELAGRLLDVPGIESVFFDLTTKPPGTIEWE